jgi:phosphoglycolate phosphatase-like HAD superfamily hydrolase
MYLTATERRQAEIDPTLVDRLRVQAKADRDRIALVDRLDAATAKAARYAARGVGTKNPSRDRRQLAAAVAAVDYYTRAAVRAGLINPPRKDDE